jgi:hypothetical protein
MTNDHLELPPDPESMNDNRAEWASTAIRHFQCTTGTDWEDAVCDLLCDLMHFCDREGFTFGDELDRARMHYEAEIAAPEDDMRPMPSEVLSVLEQQTTAAQAVIDAWATGDLAGAVRALDASIQPARAAHSATRPMPRSG